MKILFLLGKGGVGKSTLSALMSLHLSQKGKKVLLTSLDPAHNLSDIFKVKLSDVSTTIKEGLSAIETDQQKWIRRYLRESEMQLKKSYSYLSTFSMEKNFSVLQHAPALEEYAMLMAFENIIDSNASSDFLIFDMPPTGLSFKFFALPQISLIWLKNLTALREEILEKQKIISVLKKNSSLMPDDRVQQNLSMQIKSWLKIDTILRDETITLPVIVENPDELSRAESGRIKAKLKSLHIARTYDALNRVDQPSVREKLCIPQSTGTNGLENLQKNLAGINFTFFDALLNID